MKKCAKIVVFCFIFLSVVSIFGQSEADKGVDSYRNGDFEQAISILENSVKSDSKDKKAWTYLGASYLKKGLKKEAAKAFLKASEIRHPKLSKEELVKFNEGLEIISKPRAAYTDGARENGIQGEVKLAVEFSENGKTNLLYVVKALPFGLTENCIDATKRIKFKPAQKDGKPIPVIQVISHSFSIY